MTTPIDHPTSTCSLNMIEEEASVESPPTSTARKIYDFTTSFLAKLPKECFNTTVRLAATYLVKTYVGESSLHKIGCEAPLKLFLSMVGTGLATWSWNLLCT